MSWIGDIMELNLVRGGGGGGGVGKRACTQSLNHRLESGQ